MAAIGIPKSPDQGRPCSGIFQDMDRVCADYGSETRTFRMSIEGGVGLSSRCKVLVVEDDEDILAMLAFALEDEGYAVQTATNGAEALALVGTTLPGLIILDLRMPVMDGREFIERFRNQYGQCVPIVLHTAAPNPRSLARELQAQGFLSKPAELDDVLVMVERLPSDRAMSPVA